MRGAWISYLGLAAVVAVVGLTSARRGEACSLPPPFGLYGVAPADGATGIPTNTRVYIGHSGTYGGPELEDVLLRPAGGDPVAVTVAWQVNGGNFSRRLVVRPAQPLAANTTHELLGRISRDCFVDCVTTDFQLLSTFTTGAGPDTTPPVFAGLTGVQVSEVASCDNSACCGPYTAVTFVLQAEWTTASDDVGVVGVHIYKGNDLVAPAGGSFGLYQCSGMFKGGGPGADFYNSSGTYYARVYDLAGNEDSNTAGVEVTLSCDTSLDGGVPVLADGGPDASSGQAGDGSGCEFVAARRGRGRAASPTMAVFFVLSLLLLARRHRRQRQ